MGQIFIDFNWRRDPQGYYLVESERPIRVRRKGKGHAPEDFSPIRPLLATDLLFKLFAKTAITPEGVLRFVQRYGSLTWEGGDEGRGDDVQLVIHNARHMQQVLESMSKNQISSPPIPFPITPPTLLRASVFWDPENGLKWELCPNTLLDALWLQLGQALTSSGQLRHCDHCGDWFQAGRGTGRRLDSKFCSDDHRIAFNSLKRSKEQ